MTQIAIAVRSPKAVLTGFFDVLNGYQGALTGLAMTLDRIAVQDPTYPVLGPCNFAAGEVIDGNAYFDAGPPSPVFKLQTSESTFTAPDFGPGSFIAFRSENGHYGWLGVTEKPPEGTCPTGGIKRSLWSRKHRLTRPSGGGA